MKKALVGICIVLMLLIPSVNALNIGNSKVNTPTNNISDTVLPDLIIEKIVFEEGHFPFSWDILCRVQNIGNGIASGEKVKLICEGTRMLFGIFPWKMLGSFNRNYDITLNPGETKDCYIAGTTQFPMAILFLRLFCAINLNKSIYEENFSNNYFNQTFLILVFSWREIKIL